MRKPLELPGRFLCLGGGWGSGPSGATSLCPRGTSKGLTARSPAAGALATGHGSGGGACRWAGTGARAHRSATSRKSGAEPLSGGPIVEQMSKRARKRNKKGPQLTGSPAAPAASSPADWASWSGRAPFSLRSPGMEGRHCRPEAPLGGLLWA